MTPPPQFPKAAHISEKFCSRNILRLGVALLIIGLFIASYFRTGIPLERALFAFVPIVALLVLVELIASPGNRLRNRERWRIRPTQITVIQLLRGISNILIHTIIAWITLQILQHPPHFAHFANELLRLVAGAAMLYSWVAIIAATISFLFLVAGYALPQIHRHPVAARSVEEFWARRWNIVVSAWLHAFVFLPFARRGHHRLGIMLAFLVSGAIHGWLVLSLGTWAAFTATLFFVIQAPVILIENRLHIQNWPTPIARAWTVIIILGTSPLFIDPGLRLFGL
jgi:hypothetical protein